MTRNPWSICARWSRSPSYRGGQFGTLPTIARSGSSVSVIGATPTQLALAWLLARSPAMLPIPGTGSVSHLEENIAAAAIRLDAGEVAQLTEAIA